jgi:hypothetical protein
MVHSKGVQWPRFLGRTEKRSGKIYRWLVFPAPIAGHLHKLAVAATIAIGQAAAQTGGISTDALALSGERALAVRREFPIFSNGDGPFHGFVSGKFGPPGLSPAALQQLLDRLEVNAHCVYDPTSPDGCSTDLQRVDCERGTVLRIKFPPLTGNQFVGLNIEEPEKFSDPVRGNTVGYDLRGSTRLIFSIATTTPGTVRLNIGMAGRNVPVEVSRSDGWKQVSLNFSNLGGLSDTQLQNVQILFAVATNSDLLPGGAVVLFDDIRLDPSPDRQRQAIGAPAFYQGMRSRSAITGPRAH